MNFLITTALVMYSRVFHQQCPNSGGDICTNIALRQMNPDLCRVDSLNSCSPLAQRQLDSELCDLSRPYIDSFSLGELPKSQDGNTNGAYFLPNAVIKELPRATTARRKLEQSTYVRELCEKNNYEHLVVPKSCISTEGISYSYSTEEKFPISSYDNNWFLYEQNHAAFKEAAKELTGLLMRVKISDLVGKDVLIGGGVVGTPRYDNIAPVLEYTESGVVGKFVMIDLDHLSLDGSRLTSLEACEIAINFCPQHFDSILEEAKRFDPQIERHYQELEKIRDNALSSPQRVQWNFMIENQITHENVHILKPLTYTPERIEKLEMRIRKKLESHKIGSLIPLRKEENSLHLPEGILSVLFGEKQALVSKLTSIKTDCEAPLREAVGLNSADNKEEEGVVVLRRRSIKYSEKELSEMSLPNLAALRRSGFSMDPRFEVKSFFSGEHLGYHRNGLEADIAKLLEDVLPFPDFSEGFRHEVARVILLESFTEWVENGDAVSFQFIPKSNEPPEYVGGFKLAPKSNQKPGYWFAF